jgi:hypothetical protein
MNKKVPLIVDLSGPNGNVFPLVALAQRTGRDNDVDVSALDGLMERKYEDTLKILVELFDFVDTSNTYPEIIAETEEVEVIVRRK